MKIFIQRIFLLLKQAHDVIVFFAMIFIFCLMIFAIGNILSGKIGIQEKVDAYSNYLKINGDKPELASAEKAQYRTQLEGEMSANTIQAFNIIILGITALIILWYSVETRRLADLTEKQIKIKLRPVIVVEDVYRDKVKIKNIGESSALSVEIQPILARKAKDSQNSYNIRFDGCPVLEGEASNEREGIFELCEKSGRTNPNPAPFLEFQNVFFIDDYYITIVFKDIEKGVWETKTIVDKKGIHFQGIYERIV